MRTLDTSPLDGRLIAMRADSARDGVRTRCAHTLRRNAS